MTTIISLLLLSTAGVSYAISQLIMHGNLKWSDNEHDFWGRNSGARKYKRLENGNILLPAPKTWYYKLFNLKYKERFPGSATIFVALTDGYHLMQMVFLLCISAAIAIHMEGIGLRGFVFWLLIYRAVFGVVFTVCYKLLAR